MSDYEEDFEDDYRDENFSPEDNAQESITEQNLNQDLASKTDIKPKNGVISEERVKLISNAEKYIQKIAEKHPSKAIEKSVAEARMILDRVKGSASAAAQLSTKDGQKNQEKKLGKALKKMNEDLNKLIDYIKDIDIKKKDQDRPVSQLLKVRNEEIKNSDKQMMNLMVEHQRLKARLEQVSNPTYMIDLKTNISQADARIKQLKREKKDLEVQQFRRERKMEKIIDPYGEPGNLKSVNDAQKELEVITQKLTKLRAKKEKLADSKVAQDNQMKSLKERLERIMQKAQEHGIDEDIKKEERRMRDTSQNSANPDSQSSTTNHANILRKKKVMLQAFESQKKKTDMFINKERKEYKELCVQKKKLNKDLTEKANLLKQKTEKMGELIEKAKKYSDPNTQELLSKWENSNQKMKEMYQSEINQMNSHNIENISQKSISQKTSSRRNLPEMKGVKQSEDARSSYSDVKEDVSHKSSDYNQSSNNKAPLNIKSKLSNASLSSQNKQSSGDQRSVTSYQAEEKYSDHQVPVKEKELYKKPVLKTKPMLAGKPSPYQQHDFTQGEEDKDEPYIPSSESRRSKNSSQNIPSIDKKPVNSSLKPISSIPVLNKEKPSIGGQGIANASSIPTLGNSRRTRAKNPFAKFDNYDPLQS
ncbi:unnamed protein product [Moneuplotes crassus]|uniref:Uncharacterized protein n=1 Tax=Euplotes crassus TaxID=5936 RepID=A0AAD1X5U1_EUPCR|nr:unnamed protein product [Moneuplotes crassus]